MEESHDNGGGDAGVSTAESAANAVGATRIGHEARSLARVRGAHEASDGHETAVAAAATPRLRAGWCRTHGGSSSGVGMTMGAGATAAAAESAADAIGTTRVEHEARSLARAQGALEKGDGRETAVAAAATPQLSAGWCVAHALVAAAAKA